MRWLMIAKLICKCIFLNFYEQNLSHFVVFINQYTTHKYLNYPEHSSVNLFSNHHIQTFAKLAKHLENLYFVI